MYLHFRRWPRLRSSIESTRAQQGMGIAGLGAAALLQRVLSLASSLGERPCEVCVRASRAPGVYPSPAVPTHKWLHTAVTSWPARWLSHAYCMSSRAACVTGSGGCSLGACGNAHEPCRVRLQESARPSVGFMAAINLARISSRRVQELGVGRDSRFGCYCACSLHEGHLRSGKFPPLLCPVSEQR